MVEISSKAKMSSFDTLLDASFIPCKMADLPAEVGEVEIEVASNGGIGVPEPQIEVETTAGNGVPEPQIEVETTVIDHGLTIEVQPGEEMVYIAANVGNDIEVDGADDIEEAEREDQPAKKKKDGGGEGKKARAPRASKGKAGANASRKAASTSPAVVASSFQGMDVTFEATGELFFFWRPFKLVKSMYRGIMCDRCRTALYFLSRGSSFFHFYFFLLGLCSRGKKRRWEWFSGLFWVPARKETSSWRTAWCWSYRSQAAGWIHKVRLVSVLKVDEHSWRCGEIRFIRMTPKKRKDTDGPRTIPCPHKVSVVRL